MQKISIFQSNMHNKPEGAYDTKRKCKILQSGDGAKNFFLKRCKSIALYPNLRALFIYATTQIKSSVSY